MKNLRLNRIFILAAISVLLCACSGSAAGADTSAVSEEPEPIPIQAGNDMQGETGAAGGMPAEEPPAGSDGSDVSNEQTPAQGTVLLGDVVTLGEGSFELNPLILDESGKVASISLSEDVVLVQVVYDSRTEWELLDCYDNGARTEASEASPGDLKGTSSVRMEGGYDENCVYHASKITIEIFHQ